MQNNIHPKLKPLISDLKKNNIGLFLSSTDFSRECIRCGVEDQWDKFYKSAENERGFISTHFDHESYDAENALILLLEWAISKNDNQNQLHGYLNFILSEFINWSKNELFFEEVFTDLELLNIEKGYIENIKSKYLKHKSKFKKKYSKKNKLSIIIEDSSFETKKKQWLKSISKAEIEKVVDEIIDYGVENENDFIGLSRRWHTLKSDYHKGVLERKEYEIENNKITEALLNFIKTLKDT